MSFLYDVTCYTYEKAVSTFGDELPTVEQIGELKVESTIVASVSPFVSSKIDGGEEV